LQPGTLAQVLVTLCFSSCGLIAAEVRQLYFVSGCPSGASADESPNLRYPVGLHTLGNDGKLRQLREIVSSASGVEFIAGNYDLGVIVMGGPGISKVNQFTVLHIVRPWNPITFTYPYQDGLVTKRLLDLPSSGPALALHLAGLNENRTRLEKERAVAMDLATGETRAFPWPDYRHVAVSGLVGGPAAGEESMEVFADDSRPLTFRMAGRIIDSGIPPPLGADLRNQNRVLLLTKNRSFATLLPVDFANWRGEFWILDLVKNQWHSIVLPGDATVAVRASGPWLMGVVDERDTTGSRGAGPGEKQRRQKPTATGFPVDWSLRLAQRHRPGTLLLYHTGKRVLYRMETGQGDSEVLQVEGDTVFYRVNTTLYRAKIGPRKVAPGERIAESPVVADIHWAFYGPPGPP